MKYFFENKRELHVACAGSLLGVALKNQNISFPVGKVNWLEMFPMSFKEFLIANGQEKYIELFSDWQTTLRQKVINSSARNTIRSVGINSH